MEELKSASSEHIESYELSDSNSPNRYLGAELQAFTTELAQRDPKWHAHKAKHLSKNVRRSSSATNCAAVYVSSNTFKRHINITEELTNFLDQTTLTQARISALEEGLSLKGTEFNTIISILFTGYIFGSASFEPFSDQNQTISLPFQYDDYLGHGQCLAGNNTLFCGETSLPCVPRNCRSAIIFVRSMPQAGLRCG